MNWIVAPDQQESALPDVLPSLLGAMGTAGFGNALGFPDCRSAALLLVDGLGWTLLREHPADAPFLASLATGSPVKAGFPTTTATSITSLGTGRCAGEHGVVGYSFAAPSGALLHSLSWGGRDAGGTRCNMLESWPPEEVQPAATVLEQAADAGVPVRLAVPAEFEGTGLTRAALRGGEFRGLRAMGDLAAELLAAVWASEPTLCYGYHGHLDLLGHEYGPGSLPWRLQLSQIDRLVSTVAERLPSSAMLVVVADHGMVTVDPAETLDADTHPVLREGVRLLGGEPRARHVYARAGAGEQVHAAWQETIGQRGLVLTGEQAIDEGWFGSVVTETVRPRIGDVIAVMREGGVIRSAGEPGSSVLWGHHGSLTAAEQYVPVLTITGGQ